MRVGAAIVVGGLSLFPSPQALSPSPFLQWRPEDRVVISDFSVITGLAASPFFVYAASARALLIYDRAAHRWQLPVTAFDGYPRALVSVAMADRADEAVWLGTADGWARYDARIRQWQQGPAFGGVSDFAVDPDDPVSGIYVRDGNGWSFLPRGGLIALRGRAPPPRAEHPLDARSAMAQAPQADALRALMLTDPRLRSYQITAAARTPDQNEMFLGTNGLGVIRLDGFGSRWETLSYGLPGPSTRALAPAPDGVWVGLAPRGSDREGVAFIPADASGARWVGGEGARGLGFRQVRRMLARGGRLWIATDQGVARLDPSSERVAMFPVTEPLTLAPGPDGVWVGAQYGLSFVADSGAVTPYDVGRSSIVSLLSWRDTLWAGSAAGLLMLAPGASAPSVLANVPALNAAVVALAHCGDTLVAATLDQLAWRNPVDGVWTPLRPAADLGRLTALAPDQDGVWVGGERGVALWRLGSGRFSAIRVPQDLPAGARDLLVAPPYLWVATDSGVVRLVREAVAGR